MKIGKLSDYESNHPNLKRLLSRLSKDSASIIDLGCQLPLFLFDLQLEYGFNKFKGVDKLNSELDIIESHAQDYNHGIENIYNSIQEVHTDYLSQFGPKYSLSNETINTYISEYNSNYRIFTGIDITQSNLDFLGKADIVFLMGVLHFIENQECFNLASKLGSIINDEGYIFITTNHKENANMTDSRISKKLDECTYQNKFTKQIVHLKNDIEFESFIKKLEESSSIKSIVKEKYRNPNSDGFMSFLYIGQKIKNI